MTSFLAAQADDPFDPVPMLIHADWLEEHGDPTAAAALRGLAESGTPSLHALALEATLRSVPFEPDRFDTENGYGHGDWFEREEDWSGCGFGGESAYWLEGIGYEVGDGEGVGDGDDVDG